MKWVWRFVSVQCLFPLMQEEMKVAVMWRWDVGSAQSGQALLNSAVKALAMELMNIWHFLEIIVNLDVPGAIRNLVCCGMQEPHVAKEWYLL